MKNIKKKTLVCILSAIVLFCSMTSTSITVYATEEDTTHGGGGYGTGTDNDGDHESNSGVDHGGGGHAHEPVEPWDKKFDELCHNAAKFISLVSCQTSAVLKGDYTLVWDNFRAYFYNDDGTINTDTVTYDEATDSITMDISPLVNTLAGNIGLVYVPANERTDSITNIVLSAYKNKSNYFMYYRYYGSVNVILCDLDSNYLVNNPYKTYKSFSLYNKDTLELCADGFADYNYGKETQAIITPTDHIVVENGGKVLNPNTPEPSYKSSINNINSTFYGNVAYCYWKDINSLSNYLSGSTYLGSSFGQNGTITIPVSDLEKDWETAYNTIVEELDGIKEATGERPTQKQIDDAIEQVLGELQDIGGNIGDIGGEIGGIGDDVEEIAKTLDDLYKLLDECHDSLEELNQSLSEGVYNQEQILDSLEYLELIYDNLSQFHVDYAQANAVLLNELEAIKNLLSASLSPGGGQDTSGLVSSINTALQDIRIFMKDRLITVLENLSGSSADISGALDDANITLEEIKDILSRMEEADIDTSSLEEALEKIRETISETGEANSADLSDMKELLSDIQDVLIEMKSGMAVKDNYTEVLDNIYSLMEDMYKLQKIGTALEVADLLSDFAGLLDSGDTSVFDRMYTSFSNVANASKERFPTSLPWDLIAVFSLFNAEPVVPHYEIPFVIPSLGINEVMVIDLSEFEQLSKASRTFLSILFVLLLIHLTRKMTATDKGSS